MWPALLMMTVSATVTELSAATSIETSPTVRRPAAAASTAQISPPAATPAPSTARLALTASCRRSARVVAAWTSASSPSIRSRKKRDRPNSLISFAAGKLASRSA